MGPRISLLSVFSLLCHLFGSDVIQMAAGQQHLNHMATMAGHIANHIVHQETRASALRTTLAQHTTTITYLTNRLAEQDAIIANLTRRLEDREQEMNNVNTYCKNHVNALSQTQSQGSLNSSVAFTVHFEEDSVGNLTQPANHHKRRLLFDSIQFMQGGNVYNTSTGLFTVPSDGTYALFLTIQRADQYVSDCIEASVVKNGHLDLLDVSACPKGYTTSSNMAVVWLKHGNTVEVRSSDSENILGFVHTTFSGIKLANS